MGIFISRLLPVVRHLIGIPAGIVKMNFLRYSLYTVIGAALWTALLCWVGAVAGQDKELMEGNAHRFSIWLAGGALVLGLIYYFFVHRHMKSGSKDIHDQSQRK